MTRETTMPIFVEERRARIAELVVGRGRVMVPELTALFAVSEPTIRKDLAILERQRLLRRTHGGAIALRMLAEPEWTTRETMGKEAKERIALACLEELHDGGSAFFDSGTTVGLIAANLGPRRVTILTNALGVAQSVVDLPHVRHTVLGGQYYPAGACFLGPLAIRSLDDFAFTTAFIGVSGVSASGISVADVAEAQLKLAVIERAKRVIVPADHRKIGATDFARVCTLDRIDLVVTDEQSDHLEALARESGFQVKVAG